MASDLIKFIHTTNNHTTRRWLTAEPFKNRYFVTLHLMLDGVPHTGGNVVVSTDADLLRICLLTGLRCNLIKENDHGSCGREF